MKFGSQLKESLYAEWREFYLDYTRLKKHLKHGEKEEGGYTEKDESEFVELLDKELEKIYAFQNSKYEQIKDRVRNCENAVANISKGSPLNISERYAEVEREINEVTEELNELAKYARLNYTGIVKIVKKHDRRTRYILRPMFNVRLNACPFYKENYEPIIVQLSRLYHIVHKGLNPEQQQQPTMLSPTPNLSLSLSSSWKPPPIMPTQRFSRQSSKFWVHPNNVMEVRTTILRHLPVLIYKDYNGGLDSSISSIYFDNASFALYQDKVDRKGGEQLIRMRWYGSKKNKQIFVERKVRVEDGEEIKDRFTMKEKHVDAFIRGEYSFENRIRKMRATPGKTETEINQFEQLVTDMQNIIRDKNLVPVIRTYYSRMAFQIPGESSVRISLDTDFASIREDNFDGVERRTEGKWRRADIEKDSYPFTKLPASDIVHFPHAVLEVKLNLKDDRPEPRWVKELMESHLVEEAPQFSKYVHGIATLFTSQAPSLPFWLPNIDKDILKPPGPPKDDYDSEDESPMPSTSTTAPMYIPQRRRSKPPSGQKSVNYVEVVVDNNRSRAKGKAKAKFADHSSDDYEEADERTPLVIDGDVDSHVREDDPFYARLFPFLRKRAPQEREPVPLPPGVRVPKKVETPVRVEPKVYFANERTYFAWTRFSLLLGSFSLALFNSADNLGQLMGFMYAVISVSTLIYALLRYHKRNQMINARHPGPYDDLTAPPLVCAALFAAVGLNFILKLAPKMVEGRLNFPPFWGTVHT